jgi:hypothetical protein
MHPSKSHRNRPNFYVFKRYFLIGVVAVATAIGITVLVKSRSRAQSKQSIPIADQLLYRGLFHHVLALKKKVSEAEQKGEDATQFRTHFQRNTNLTDGEAAVLEQTALEYEQSEKSLDAQAKTIIAAYRAQFVNGQAPNGRALPPPPAQLKTLSQERDALTLRERDRLRAAFGSDFDRFDSVVKARIQADNNRPSHE